MPQLETITIQGFKSINSIQRLELMPINIVIGPNGSGKSNFIGVFSLLHAIREGRLQDYVAKAGGANKILHFGSKVTSKLYLKISFAGETNEYSIGLEPTETDELIPSTEYTYFWNKAYSNPISYAVPRSGKEAGISNVQLSNRVSQYVRDHLDKWRVYHFHDTSTSSPMKNPLWVHLPS